MAFTIISLLIYTLVFSPIESGYIITTPRRWTIGAGSQICASLEKGTFSASDSLQYKLEEVQPQETPSFYQRFTDLSLPLGESFGCINVPVPPTEVRSVRLRVIGSLNSQPVAETVNLAFVGEAEGTFVTTDKYLYRPGQKVQFRILSVKGPNISISTDSYKEINVINPSNTRIAQWNDVDNSAGLVHLSFDLYNEIEEGNYIIEVQFLHRPTVIKDFQVFNIVPPRYEIVVGPTSAILGSDENVAITLCARYTFGEPVRGIGTVTLTSEGSETYATLIQEKQIDGCQKFIFPSRDLFLEFNNCHMAVRYLTARAVVVEDGTGVDVYAENSFIPIYRKGILFKDKTKPLASKPYLPIIAKIVTTYADGKPAINEPMEVCIIPEETIVCKNFSTNSDGILKFIIPPIIPPEGIRVRAINFPRVERIRNTVMRESAFLLFQYDYRQYVDSMNASLAIMQNMLQCTTGENISFKIPVVYVTTENILAEVYVQIASRGRVLVTNKIDVQLSGSEPLIREEDTLVPVETLPEGVIRGSFVIPMTLPDQSSPQISILVWYVKKDGTVVADAADVEVSECLPHKVSFEWASPKVEPGKETNFVIKGAKNALCSIGVIDKSVEILSSGNNNYLNIENILKVVLSSQVERTEDSQQNLDYCLAKYGSDLVAEFSRTEMESKRIDPYSTVEALHMFNDAGYAVMSNLHFARRFCMELIMLAKKRLKGENLSITSPPSLPLPAFGAFEGPIISSEIPIPDPETTTFIPEPPTERPENEDVDGIDSSQERSYLPETWLWLLTPLSSSGELSETMTIPDLVTEWIGNAVCVHPEEGVGISPSSSVITFTPFFVDITLPSSATRGEILPITISVFNYLEDDLPVRVFVEDNSHFEFIEGETGVRELCIRSTYKAVESIKVNLTQIGVVNITVEASSQPLSSGYCGSGSPPQRTDKFVRPLPVEAEGYLRERTFTEYICTEDLVDLSAPVASWLLEVPISAVMDSERAWVTAVGDLIGPTFKNLADLVRLPYGCAEQNLINFAPNVYILQYLDASDQITPFIRETVIKYLNEGYQTELWFRRSDGSYSSFGSYDFDGSTWLTAFVVKSFAQAKPYIMIDEASLQESITWLKDLQEFDGCYASRGFVYTYMLQGGITDRADSHRLLTAYVLAAILEMGESDNTTAAAVRCVERDTSTHPYSLALRSYSLALAKAPSAKDVIDQLLLLSTSDSSTLRWILEGREGEDISLQVELAAYALLGLITYDYNSYKDEARKIARWISIQRNGQGGFVSTQDTVVALQALATFEKAKPNEPMDLDITLSSADFDHSFKITHNNRFVQQRVNVPILPASIELYVDGVGCALVQGVLRYHVLTDSNSDAFDLKIDVEYVPDEGCGGKTRNITACTSYTLPNNEASIMAIIEFKLVTGYVANQQDLEGIVGNKTGIFKKFEVDGQKVNLYLDRITSEEICISLRAFPEIEIGDAKPGSVSVYDYYRPELITTQILDLSFPTCPT